MVSITPRRETSQAQRTTVRVDGNTHSRLRELAEQLNMPMQDVLAQAVEFYRRQLMVDAANAAYAALRENPETQRELDEERILFESTLMDEMRNDPVI